MQGNDRVAVTGAAGWLGRELINQLHDKLPKLEILALGSRPSEIEFADGVTLPVHEWAKTRVQDWEPSYFVHLAFLTRERQSEFSPEQYLMRNERLATAALEAFQWKSVQGVLLASSGAADPEADDQYGRLKAKDELDFAREGELSGTPTVIARAWSLSGAHCSKPQHFLFFDLLRQAISPDISTIEIRSAHKVMRKYVDAGQYLEVCLGALVRGWSGVIDSTGPLTEAQELAETIQQELGTRKSIVRPKATGLADEFFSNSPALDVWAHELGVNLLDLSSQIRKSMVVLSRA